MSTITDTIVNAYLETLLWSETLSACDEDGNSTSITIPESAPGPFAGDTFEDGTPLESFLDTSDMSDLCPDVVAEAKADLEAFGGYVEETLGFDPFAAFDASQVAHDFCLSRNGHGAGFFDGDYTVKHSDLSEEHQVKADMAEERGIDGLNVAVALQSAAKTFGTLGLSVWVSDAGALMVESHS
jgi:hypothetical protein